MSSSSSSSVATHPPDTVSGIVTSWLPLTSAWPVVPECLTGGIYSQLGGNGAKAIADDPYFGISINKSLTCWPPIATLWWGQSTTVPLLTHTSLGPIVCPEGYTTATTSAVDDQSTFVACCPSNYAFQSVEDSGTLGQCNSPLSVGQVLTYVELTAGFPTAYNTITAQGASVYGIQLNGYNFASSTTTSSSSSSSTGTGAGTGTAASATSTAPTGSATSSNAASLGGLSTGAKAGIGIGVALGVLGVIAIVVAWTLIRKHRENVGIPDNGSHFITSPPPVYSGISKANANLRGAEQYEPQVRHEMEHPSQRYELN